MTERHARALLPLAEDDRLEALVQRIVKETFTVAQTESLVTRTLEQRPQKGMRLFVFKDFRIFTSTINRAIDVMKQAGIKTQTKQDEDEHTITYTIIISKTPVPQRHMRRSDGHAV